MITEKDYYSIFPDGYHITGDIWMRLPSHGLLHCDYISGIIVTPACDLANCKTETITYVPVIPLTDFYKMPEFKAEIIRSTKECLGRIGFANLAITENSLNYELKEKINTLNLPKDKKNDQLRICKAFEFLSDQPAKFIDKDGSHIFDVILGKNWKNIKSKIIRNSYRNDLYYLPPDNQATEWSPIPVHAVALLRYLITVPTSFLNCAYESDERNWPKNRNNLIEKKYFWCYQCHESLPPLRALRLKDAFLSDLLTKLISIYVRLGAPDLHPTVLAKIESEI